MCLPCYSLIKASYLNSVVFGFHFPLLSVESYRSFRWGLVSDEGSPLPKRLVNEFYDWWCHYCSFLSCDRQRQLARIGGVTGFFHQGHKHVTKLRREVRAGGNPNQPLSLEEGAQSTMAEGVTKGG